MFGFGAAFFIASLARGPGAGGNLKFVNTDTNILGDPELGNLKFLTLIVIG
jgi:hypothetical protein